MLCYSSDNLSTYQIKIFLVLHWKTFRICPLLNFTPLIHYSLHIWSFGQITSSTYLNIPHWSETLSSYMRFFYPLLNIPMFLTVMFQLISRPRGIQFSPIKLIFFLLILTLLYSYSIIQLSAEIMLKFVEINISLDWLIKCQVRNLTCTLRFCKPCPWSYTIHSSSVNDYKWTQIHLFLFCHSIFFSPFYGGKIKAIWNIISSVWPKHY